MNSRTGPKIIGEIARLNSLDTVYNASSAIVLAIQGGKALAFAEVDRDERFEIELPDDVRGEIEIRLGLYGAAPVFAEATGDDILVTLFYNNALYFA